MLRIKLIWTTQTIFKHTACAPWHETQHLRVQILHAKSMQMYELFLTHATITATRISYQLATPSSILPS